MKITEYRELEKEKSILYALIDDARGRGIAISEAKDVLRQSEKLDSLIQKLQQQKYRPENKDTI